MAHRSESQPSSPSGPDETLAHLACEVTDALSVVAPRGWTRAELSLDRHGDTLRVAQVDTELAEKPKPMPALGMDPGARMAGLAAALTDALHLLHGRGVEWSGARATVTRQGMNRLMLTLNEPSGPPAASISVPQGMAQALFLTEPFLEALETAEAALPERQDALALRLGGCTGWRFDQKTAKASFDLPGRPALTLDAELLGTWTSEDEMWLWAWANSTVDPAGTKRVEAALAPDAQAPGLAPFWRERYPCEEPFAHRVAGAAAVKSGAQAVWRGGFGKGWAYLAIF